MDSQSNDVDQLISTFVVSPTTELHRLTSVLIEEEKVDVQRWIPSVFRAFVTLENWAWRILGDDDRTRLEAFENLLKILAKINRKFIFELTNVEMKVELLLPSTSEPLDGIFAQLDRCTDDRFLVLINLWLENVAFLNYKHIELGSLPLIISITEHLTSNFLLTDTFIDYLRQLQNVSPTISPRHRFFLRICPFFLNNVLPSKPKSIPLTERQLFEHLHDDLTKVFLVQSQTVGNWSVDLLGCLTQLAGLVAVCSWQKAADVLRISPNEIEEFLRALIEILSRPELHRQVNEENSNDATIFLEFILGIFIYFSSIAECHEFLRSQTKFSDTLLILDYVKNERINLISYRIQSEILPEEQIKQLAITKNIDEIFFRYLRRAWAHPLKMHNKIPLEELLRGERVASVPFTFERLLFFFDRFSQFVQERHHQEFHNTIGKPEFSRRSRRVLSDHLRYSLVAVVRQSNS